MSKTNENALIAYYAKRYEEFGFNSKGADWGDCKKHNLRLITMLELLGQEAINNQSILDVGCGYGQLLRILEDTTKYKSYLGIDPCSKAIQFAKQNIAGKAEFVCASIDTVELTTEVKTCICCGVFTKKYTLRDVEMAEQLRRFFKLISKNKILNVCFNTMSFLCDKKDSELYYPEVSIITNMLEVEFGYNLHDLHVTNKHLKYECIWRFSVSYE